jgi:acetyl-CoA C-acetyltransferase
VLPDHRRRRRGGRRVGARPGRATCASRRRRWCPARRGTPAARTCGGYACVARAAAKAYAHAGRAPAEIDVLEVHDAFTVGEIFTLEALGIAPRGKGAELAPTGPTQRDGVQPVNPSGGLLSRGHRLGGTGLAQLAEIAWQLRGRAGARQVARHRVGMVETMGGGAAGMDGNACVVTILSTDG